MDSRTWTRPVAGDSDVQVELQSSAPSDAVVLYQLNFPYVVGGSGGDLLVTGGGAIEQHGLSSESGIPVSDLTVSIPNEGRVERLVVKRGEERIVLHLPSGVLLESVERALDGDEEAADQLVRAFASPVQIPLVCGSFLRIQDTVRLIRTLARANRHAQSMLHSYRYAIVRSALVCRTGLNAASSAEFEELVTGLNEIDEIGGVAKIGVLADVMATVHGSVDETERLLESLGYDIDALDDVANGLLTLCYLAQTVCCDGIERVEQFDLRQDLPSSRDYDRRKRAVLRSDYGDRGDAWRKLLNDSRRQSSEEFRSVLAHTLYWTAEESRSDSRMAELLHRAAEDVAEQIGDRRIKYGARYNRYLAAGHRLRGTHCYGPAIENFEHARRLATDYRFLAEWQPILAKGLVSARLQSTRGDRIRALEILDDTIEALLAADPPKWAATRSVHHLKAQKCETEAGLYSSEYPHLARDSLEEAGNHYEIIGFDRSRDRVQRKLVEFEKAIGLEEPADTLEDISEEAPPTQERFPRGREPQRRPIHATEDGSDFEPESMEEPVPAVLESEEYPDEVEQDEHSDRFEDPYVF